MTGEQQVPKSRILLVRERLRKRHKSALELQRSQLWSLQLSSPRTCPPLHLIGRTECVMNKSHNMRLSAATLSHHDYRLSCRSRGYSIQRPTYIAGRVGYIEKFRSCA